MESNILPISKKDNKKFVVNKKTYLFSKIENIIKYAAVKFNFVCRGIWGGGGNH